MLLRRTALTLLTAGVILAAWAFWWEPRRLVVRETSIVLPCWRGKPVHVAVASDLHIGSPYTGIEKLERVVREINAQRPDAVLLLGDFVVQGVIGGRFVPPEVIAGKLTALRSPLGTFAVLGNHDWWFDAPRVERAFRAAGIVLLEDDAVPMKAFWLAGVSDFMEGKHDVAKAMLRVTDDRPVIAITHNPDVFPAIPARVCLTIAGHTHGGQVALPLVGRPIVPSRYGERYAIGHIHEHGKQLFVTAGVGTSIIPVRFRVPPELVIVQIRGANP